MKCNKRRGKEEEEEGEAPMRGAQSDYTNHAELRAKINMSERSRCCFCCCQITLLCYLTFFVGLFFFLPVLWFCKNQMQSFLPTHLVCFSCINLLLQLSWIFNATTLHTGLFLGAKLSQYFTVHKPRGQSSTVRSLLSKITMISGF